MDVGVVATPPPPIEEWPRNKPFLRIGAPQDAKEFAPKLSTESKALLFAISEILGKYEEQVQNLLLSHETHIIHAIQDVKLSISPKFSTSPKADDFHRTSAPKTIDFQSVTSPVDDLQSHEDSEDAVHLPHIVDSRTSDSQDEPGHPQTAHVATNCSSAPHISPPCRKSREAPPNEDSEDELDTERRSKSEPVFARHRTLTDMIPDYMRGNNEKMAAARADWKRMATARLSFKSIEGALKETKPHLKVRSILASKATEIVVTAMILLNAIAIGVQADWAVKHAAEADTGEPIGYRVAHTLFGVFFLVELVLRIYGFRFEFFARDGKDFTWNIFDTFLVVTWTIDEIGSVFISELNLTVIRVLRIFRLVRVIRIVRVLRFFQDLRVIVAGISGAMKSLLWAVGLLCMIMYLVANCLMQLIAYELSSSDVSEHGAVLSYYGSLFKAMYTLYKSVTGGIDWGDAAQPLLDISPFLALLFSLYIAFCVLCVLNIIIGVFVDNARNLTFADEEQLVIEEYENRVRWFEQVKELFTSMIGDEGSLNRREFSLFLDDVKVQACFHRLGIDVHSTSKSSLFQLLDFDETGTVNLEEFALGLQMLNGQAKAIDLARIYYEVKRMKREVLYITGNLRATSTEGGDFEMNGSLESSADRGRTLRMNTRPSLPDFMKEAPIEKRSVSWPTNLRGSANSQDSNRRPSLD